MMDSGVSVRYLRKGEDKLWHSCSFATTPQKIQEVAPFTDNESFRPEAHLVAEHDGRIIGKMALILNDPHEAVLVDPTVASGEDIEAVAQALLREGMQTARSLKIRKIQVILQDRLPYLSALLPKMEDWGYRALWEKNLYCLNPEDFPSRPDSPLWADLKFVPFGGMGDGAFLYTLDRILQRIVNREDKGETATDMVQTFIDRCEADGCYYPEDWELALLNGDPVGVVLPASLDGNCDSGTILYVGVIPALRSRGLGSLLYYRGLKTIGRRGVRQFIDSCDVQNNAMIRIFEQLNFRFSGSQYYFEPVWIRYKSILPITLNRE